MREPLGEELLRIFPTLFAGSTLRVGDGWLWLIVDMSRRLLEVVPSLRLESIIEQHGILHVNPDECSPLPSTVYDLIGRYEELSTMTCENCGDAGRLHRSRSKTLCEKCSGTTFGMPEFF